MSDRHSDTETLLRAFIDKDIPLFKKYVEDLNEATLIELPEKIRSIKSRLDQVVTTLNAQAEKKYTEERAKIQGELMAEIQKCQDKIRGIQGLAKNQLEELSKGAQLLGSYRVGPKQTSNFLDSHG